ncbi:hypothetical protein FFLO_00997 [Filobasidium floriforme]|uniref:DNA polymerase delta subunit 4 n=1 Tax=Filobasidium floriforme TaxID=5210 RepID=A0A8K0JQS8_9TREE|nr:hypothetical protein FFLO_00997 [Filobasidium floriforme]
MSSKTRPRTTQSALGFSAKKSIHKSPTKKKAPAGIAPLFTRPNRSVTAFPDTNPFLDDDDAGKREKPQPVVERDEFGFVRTVPLDYLPLGKGKPTDQMIANLVGEKAKEDEERKEEKGEDDEEGGDGNGDRAFFLIEKRRGNVKSGRIEEGGKLNVKDKRWNELFKETKKKMGDAEPIHCDSKSHDRVHHILRVFDLSSQWGPCVGISRLERWNRAEEWGLEPPVEVRDILLTQEGQKDDTYKETVFHNTGIYVP